MVVVSESGRKFGGSEQNVVIGIGRGENDDLRFHVAENIENVVHFGLGKQVLDSEKTKEISDKWPQNFERDSNSQLHTDNGIGVPQTFVRRINASVVAFNAKRFLSTAQVVCGEWRSLFLKSIHQLVVDVDLRNDKLKEEMT